MRRLSDCSTYHWSLSIENLQKSLDILSSKAMQMEDIGIFVNQSEEIIEYLSNPNETSNRCYIWKIYNSLISNRNSTAVRMRFQQGEIMIVTLMTWEWLDYTILKGYKSYIAEETHYLFKLFQAIALLFDTSTTNCEFDAAAFLTGFKPGEAVYSYHSNGNNWYKSHSQDEYVK